MTSTPPRGTIVLIIGCCRQSGQYLGFLHVAEHFGMFCTTRVRIEENRLQDEPIRYLLRKTRQKKRETPQNISITLFFTRIT